MYVGLSRFCRPLQPPQELRLAPPGKFRARDGHQASISAVTKLHARGLDPMQIAEALDLDRALVAAILDAR